MVDSEYFCINFMQLFIKSFTPLVFYLLNNYPIILGYISMYGHYLCLNSTKMFPLKFEFNNAIYVNFPLKVVV